MNGNFLIGAPEVTSADVFRAYDSSTNLLIEPDFSISTASDVAEACRLANAAFDRFRKTDSGGPRTLPPGAIADRIEALGDQPVQRAAQESGLPIARTTGERGRTIGQLRPSATVLRESADPADGHAPQ